jgi:hypothetical protein
MVMWASRPVTDPHDTTGNHHDGKAEYPRPPGTAGLEELFRAHRQRGGFDAARERFEDSNGRILNCYFSRGVDACVALVEKRHDKRPHLLLWFGTQNLPYHVPAFCETAWRILWVAGKVERMSDFRLPESTRCVLADMLHQVAVLLLSHLEAVGVGTADPRTPDGRKVAERLLEDAARDANQELDKLEQYVDRMAIRVAVRYYLFGLPAGVLLLCPLVATVQLIAPDGQVKLHLMLSVVAGGIGSITSVMFRVTRGQKLSIDTGQGGLVTWASGIFRPFIGAVFGAAFYVLVSSGLFPLQVPDDNVAHFYAGLAFLAGFSERWAQDTIVRSAPIAPSPASSGSAVVPQERVRKPKPHGR